LGVRQNSQIISVFQLSSIFGNPESLPAAGRDLMSIAPDGIRGKMATMNNNPAKG